MELTGGAILMTAAGVLLLAAVLLSPLSQRLGVPIMLVFHMTAVTIASIVAILHGSMITDIAENHELASGRRSEGVFVAANIFVAKAVSGVGIFASSMLLLAAGFPQNATPANVSPEVIRNLALIYVPSLLAMHFGAVLFILFYRITRESHARTLDLLGL